MKFYNISNRKCIMIMNYCTRRETKSLIDRKRVRDKERNGVKERERARVCV